MKITKAIKNMICTLDKSKKIFVLTYTRIFKDDTMLEDVSKYTKAETKSIVDNSKQLKEVNADRTKFFKLVNVIFDTRSKNNNDLRKISVKYKDASCKNSYSDITHKAVCRCLNENNTLSLFFADSQTAIKSVIAENRVKAQEKNFSVYEIEKMLNKKKSKAKVKVVKAKAKAKAKK